MIIELGAVTAYATRLGLVVEIIVHLSCLSARTCRRIWSNQCRM